jgi:hypothetical protein
MAMGRHKTLQTLKASLTEQVVMDSATGGANESILEVWNGNLLAHPIEHLLIGKAVAPHPNPAAFAADVVAP